MESFKPTSSKEKNVDSKKHREAVALLLSSAMAGGAIFHQIEKSHAPSYVANWNEIREKTPFDLEPLSSIARAKLEVQGEKYVIHVGQMHIGNSFDYKKYLSNETKADLTKLIECQKQIESTITFLKKNYGIHAVYEENYMREDARDYAKQAAELHAEPQYKGLELYENAKDDLKDSSLVVLDNYRAHDLLWAESSLAGTQHGNEISNHPMIKGSMRYVWGAPYVMAARGEIDLRPAEDFNANASAFKNGTQTDEGMNIRQDAAIKLIQDAEKIDSKEQTHVLVYGAAHNFRSNVENANSVSGSTLGLIRIDPNACS